MEEWGLIVNKKEEKVQDGGTHSPKPKHSLLLLRSLNGCDCVWITIWAADERILKSRRRRSLCLTWQENFWVQDKEREEKERERVPKAHSKAGSRGGSLAHSPRKQRINSPLSVHVSHSPVSTIFGLIINFSFQLQTIHINITIKLLILNIKV